MNYQEIIDKIDEHLTKSSKPYWGDYYIGITNDINERLFGYHKVPKDNFWYIWCHADSGNISREVENHYLDMGMEGDNDGGERDSRYVYCYEIAQFTREK